MEMLGRIVASLALTTLTAFLPPSGALAQVQARIRVVDVGAGLCTVTEVPDATGNPHFMVFDAGSEFPFNSSFCLDAVKEIVGMNQIDLLVVSHPDADHSVHAREILEYFTVNQIVRTGHERDRKFWRDFDAAVTAEGGRVTDLRNVALSPGTQIPLGVGTVTLVAGWHEWLPGGLNKSESRNVISIVVRLKFEGSSVLFTGDSIGRRLGDEDGACKDAEEFMVANSALVPLLSNVVIAAHHGANNSSSSCFVEAVFGPADNRVVPRFVVFSAGHQHGHPTLDAAQRWQTVGGVSERFMFRTDRGDTERSKFHWDDSEAPMPNCEDGLGDDSIEIVLNSNGPIEVDYLQATVGPCVQ